MKLAHKIKTRFYVTGIQDDHLGEQLALIIEGTPIQFKDDVFNDLLPYERPKIIHFLSNFLETESGKIKRNETLKLI
jgi:O-succinylbenzoic acid--CoA ligase